MAKARRPARAKVRRKAAAPSPAPRARGASAAVLTQSAYARHRRVSRQAVRKAIAEGRIPVRTDRRIDVAAADIAWRANTDPDRGGHSSPASREGQLSAAPEDSEQPPAGEASPLAGIVLEDLSLNDVRKIREFIRAQQDEIALRVARRDLAPVAEIQDAEFKVARTVRDQLLTLPDQLCDQLAGVAGNPECASAIRAVLLKAINGVCRELALQLADVASHSEAS